MILDDTFGLAGAQRILPPASDPAAEELSSFLLPQIQGVEIFRLLQTVEPCFGNGIGNLAFAGRNTAMGCDLRQNRCRIGGKRFICYQQGGRFSRQPAGDMAAPTAQFLFKLILPAFPSPGAPSPAAPRRIDMLS
jgi:hypothetical protein